MIIAVLGAGHGGTTMAAHLSGSGHRVRLYDKFARAVEGIGGTRIIRLKGALGESESRLESAGTNLREAVAGAEMVMVVTPAFAHREIAGGLAPLIGDEVPVILHPGRTGGALEVSGTIRAAFPGRRPLVAEAQTLLYACRRTGPDEATVYGIKREVTFAVFPASRTAEAAEKLLPVFPQFRSVSNVLETSILNIGAIFHPAPTILNAARIEDTGGAFEHYRQGISPAVARVLERIDAERVEIARALHVPTRTTVEWLGDVYGVEGGDLYSAVQANPVYAGINAPPSLDTRYITEDVPMSLVPLAELGRLAGVSTPTMDAIIDLAGILHRTDYRAGGRTLARMGLAGLGPRDLADFVK